MTTAAMTVNFAGAGPATTEPRQANRVADSRVLERASGEAVSFPTVFGAVDEPPPILQTPEPCERCGAAVTELRIRIHGQACCLGCYKAEQKPKGRR